MKEALQICSTKKKTHPYPLPKGMGRLFVDEDSIDRNWAEI
jgi:hypothetical protein